jgi:hypothetical protein
VENRIDLGGDSFRVKKDSILYELLNRDVDTFVVLNFGNTSSVSCALCYLLSITCFCLPLSIVLDLGLLVIYYSS